MAVIAFVRGRVTAARAGEVVVDVGGIGLTLQCTPSTAAAVHVGDDAQLPASLVVREESLTLFGFADEDERQVFELLQTASGIGPRLAQAMLGVHTPDDLRRAVATEDLVALTRVPGIGKKGAQRIVVELADKLGPPTGAGSAPSAPQHVVGTDGWQGQVHAALLSLGWTGRDADAAIERVSPLVGDGVDPADVPALLKAALRTLARP
jgi:holliday junction DNA helicase RuvA